MTKIPKLPAKLFVTAKHEHYDRNDPNAIAPPDLGFLNAYEPSKSTFAKKEITQISWAYESYDIANQRFDWQGKELWTSGDKYEPWVSGVGRITTPYSGPVDPQPQFWDNSPLDGFKILKSISRISTNNKLWRILDPRGIQFEITTDCLERIIDDAGILKGGEINGKCAWMSNKNLIVVP